MCKIDGWWEAVVWHRELSSGPCDDLGGGDVGVMEGGGEAQKGGNIYIYIYIYIYVILIVV